MLSGLCPDGAVAPEQGLHSYSRTRRGHSIETARRSAELSARYWCKLYKLADGGGAGQPQGRFIHDWRVCSGMVFRRDRDLRRCLPTPYHVAGCCRCFTPRRSDLPSTGSRMRAVTSISNVYSRFRALAGGVARGDLHGSWPAYPTSVLLNLPIRSSSRSELAWVKIVLRTLDKLHVVSQAPKLCPRRSKRKRPWVLLGSTRRRLFRAPCSWPNDRTAETLETRSLVALLLSPIVVLAHGLSDGTLAPRLSKVEHALIVIMGILGGLAAVLAG